MTVQEKIEEMLKTISEKEIIKCLDDTIEKWNGAERYRVRQSVEDTFKTAVGAKVWDCLFNNDKITKLVEEAINLRMNEIIEKQISNRIREIVDKETRWDSEITKRIIENVKDIIEDLQVITSDRLSELEDIEKEFGDN
jgi:hypothetical protein